MPMPVGDLAHLHPVHERRATLDRRCDVHDLGQLLDVAALLHRILGVGINAVGTLHGVRHSQARSSAFSRALSAPSSKTLAVPSRRTFRPSSGSVLGDLAKARADRRGRSSCPNEVLSAPGRSFARGSLTVSGLAPGHHRVRRMRAPKPHVVRDRSAQYALRCPLSEGPCADGFRADRSENRLARLQPPSDGVGLLSRESGRYGLRGHHCWARGPNWSRSRLASRASNDGRTEVLITGLPDPVIRESRGPFAESALEENRLRPRNRAPAPESRSRCDGASRAKSLDLPLVLGRRGCGRPPSRRARWLRGTLFVGEVGIDGDAARGARRSWRQALVARDGRESAASDRSTRYRASRQHTCPKDWRSSSARHLARRSSASLGGRAERRLRSRDAGLGHARPVERGTGTCLQPVGGCARSGRSRKFALIVAAAGGHAAVVPRSAGRRQVNARPPFRVRLLPPRDTRRTTGNDARPVGRRSLAGRTRARASFARTTPHGFASRASRRRRAAGCPARSAWPTAACPVPGRVAQSSSREALEAAASAARGRHASRSAARDASSSSPRASSSSPR